MNAADHPPLPVAPPARPLLTDDQVQRVLVVSAHPDDHDFGAAGCIATWTAAGIAVTILVLTDGQAGGFDPTIDRADMPGIRHREQRAAAALLGVEDLRFAGHVDGELEPTPAVVRDIVRVIRDVRPQRMVFQSAQRRYDRLGASHPDHLAAGEAAIRAVFPASRNPFAFVELLEHEHLQPWTVSEFWLSAHTETNHVVDVTQVMDTKLAALRCHASQHPDQDEIASFVRGWMAETARLAGLPEGHYAEAFAAYRCD